MADVIEYKIFGDDMQLVEIELDSGEGVRAEAGAMMYMEDSDRTFFFSLLPRAKVNRIREELALQQRLKITYNQYKLAVEQVTEKLGSDRGGGSMKSYLRPTRR